MDLNNQSSSVESGTGNIRRRVIRYITGASNMFRGRNRVVIGEDNRPQWIIENREPNFNERIATNNEMMREENRQRDVERYNKYVEYRPKKMFLNELRGGRFEGASHFDSLPMEIIEKMDDYVRPRKVETVEQLGNRLDWNAINNRNISESSSEANLNSEYIDEDE